jgi:galactonate dehydratase
VPPGPGLGMELHPDLDRAFTTSRKMSDAATV